MADAKIGEGFTILVVDDAYPMRRIIQTYLEAVGFKVLLAEKVSIGLEMAKQNHPNLIISDWMMPEATGIKLVSMLREDPELKHVPVIICTAKGTKEDVVEALKKGVSSGKIQK